MFQVPVIKQKKSQNFSPFLIKLNMLCFLFALGTKKKSRDTNTKWQIFLFQFLK